MTVGDGGCRPGTAKTPSSADNGRPAVIHMLGRDGRSSRRPVRPGKISDGTAVPGRRTGRLRTLAMYRYGSVPGLWKHSEFGSTQRGLTQRVFGSPSIASKRWRLACTYAIGCYQRQVQGRSLHLECGSSLWNVGVRDSELSHSDREMQKQERLARPHHSNYWVSRLISNPPSVVYVIYELITAYPSV